MSTYCLNHAKALIHGSLSKLDVPSGVLQAPVVAPMFSTMNRLLEKRVLNSTPESRGWERLLWRPGSGRTLIFTDWRACLKSINCTVIKTNTKCSLGTKDRSNAWFVK